MGKVSLRVSSVALATGSSSDLFGQVSQCLRVQLFPQPACITSLTDILLAGQGI